MKSLVDNLPPEIARQIHPDWRKNEAEYWAVRDRLLSQYQDQWIGFADGRVIASGTSPVVVFHAAEESERHPFVTCVGHEDEPCRMRRVSFPYDVSYPGEALPILTIEFRPVSGSPGVGLGRVIADTGADASALPWDRLREESWHEPFSRRRRKRGERGTGQDSFRIRENCLEGLHGLVATLFGCS